MEEFGFKVKRGTAEDWETYCQKYEEQYGEPYIPEEGKLVAIGFEDDTTGEVFFKLKIGNGNTEFKDLPYTDKIADSGMTIDEIVENLDTKQDKLTPGDGIIIETSTGTNMFNIKDSFDAVLTSTGITNPSEDYITSNYIKVKANTTYVISNNFRELKEIAVALYDTDKHFIEYKSNTGTTVNNGFQYYRFNTTEDGYLRFSEYNTNTKIMLNKGTTYLTYEDYVEIENTISATSSGGSSSVDYHSNVTGKPKINNVTVDGNLTSSDLGVVDESVLPTLATKTYVDEKLSGHLKKQIVQSLPTQDIDKDTIYLVPKSTVETDNIYDEYLYALVSTNPDVYDWELIGNTEIDLTNYYNKTQVDTALSGKQNTLTAGSGIDITSNEISFKRQNNLSNLLKETYSSGYMYVGKADIGYDDEVREYLQDSTYDNPLAPKAIVSEYAPPRDDTEYTDRILDVGQIWEYTEDIDYNGTYILWNRTQSGTGYGYHWLPIADASQVQEKLTAGSNVSISNNVISATDTTYSAGNGIDITSDTVSVDLDDSGMGGTNLLRFRNNKLSLTNYDIGYNADVKEALTEGQGALQSKLTAGTNITIDSNNVISANADKWVLVDTWTITEDTNTYNFTFDEQIYDDIFIIGTTVNGQKNMDVRLVFEVSGTEYLFNLGSLTLEGSTDVNCYYKSERQIDNIYFSYRSNMSGSALSVASVIGNSLITSNVKLKGVRIFHTTNYYFNSGTFKIYAKVRSDLL